MKTDDSQDQTMPRRSIRRHRRADEQRRRALSPVRILIMVLALPLTTGIIALGTYFRATDRERPEAVLHLVALAGCDATRAMGFGAFHEGDAGYHKRNDPDGNGIACETAAPVMKASPTVLPSTEAPKQRMVGNAKFVRP
ncbi:excalibur calcium-binding domain-containing protein [Ruegeria sp. ANG-S4]|uniref:excalibur calcium-binding domain-containing protein n=1 Tax=Ruegeria sp. ANG-S4 TaxID=1577904 RepID=UPI001F4C6117|nr:excalibur calcium-binding domain-containing protein [Ruegeria sp. ANG-S4]